MNIRSRLPGLALYGVPGLLAAVGVFFLPYRINAFVPVSSIAYGVGYNNAVAVVSVWLALSVAYLLWRLRLGGAHGVTAAALSPAPAESMPAWHGFAAAGIYTLLTGLIFVVSRNDYFSEQAYFLRRLFLALQGDRPYIDFEFAYGPAFILGPKLVAQVLAPLGVSARGAYYLFYAACSLAGIYLLYQLIRHLPLVRDRRVLVFWLLAIGLYYPFMGLNANILRFTAAPAALLALHRLARDATGTSAYVRTGLGAVALTIANFLLSPEFGIAFWVASSAYLLHRVMIARHALLGPLVVNVLAPVGVVWGLPAYMESVLTYGSGGAGLPVVPAPHILLYLFGLIAVLPPLAAQASSPGVGRDSLTLAAIALALALIPGALGRCDPGHVLNYGLLSFLLVFAASRAWHPAAFRIYAAVFFVILVVGNQFTNLFVIKWDLLQGVYPHLQRYLSADAFHRSLHALGYTPDETRSLWRELRASGSPTPSLDGLLAFPAMGLPLIVDADEEHFLRVHQRLAPDYYLDNLNVFAQAQIDRKLRDTGMHDYVLVRSAYLYPPHLGADCDWDTDWPHLERYLSVIFKYPMHLVRRNRIPYHGCQILQYLAQHYDTVTEIDGHSVLRRRPGAAP